MGESSPNLVTLIDMLRSDAGEKILFWLATSIENLQLVCLVQKCFA
jgi:hypothetical protein